MEKFINWFKKNVFEASYVNQDCYAIKLFGIFIDFRCWYKYDDDPDMCYHFESDCQKYINEVEKRNAKRKNKIPIPTYSRIPWYVSIINWRTLYYRSRSIIYLIVGFVLGLIVKGFV